MSAGTGRWWALGWALLAASCASVRYPPDVVPPASSALPERTERGLTDLHAFALYACVYRGERFRPTLDPADALEHDLEALSAWAEEASREADPEPARRAREALAREVRALRALSAMNPGRRFQGACAPTIARLERAHEDMERRRQRAADWQAAWSAAEASRDRGIIQGFLEIWPDPPLADFARDLLGEIEADEQAARASATVVDQSFEAGELFAVLGACAALDQFRVELRTPSAHQELASALARCEPIVQDDRVLRGLEVESEEIVRAGSGEEMVVLARIQRESPFPPLRERARGERLRRARVRLGCQASVPADATVSGAEGQILVSLESASGEAVSGALVPGDTLQAVATCTSGEGDPPGDSRSASAWLRDARVVYLVEVDEHLGFAADFGTAFGWMRPAFSAMASEVASAATACAPATTVAEGGLVPEVSWEGRRLRLHVELSDEPDTTLGLAARSLLQAEFSKLGIRLPSAAEARKADLLSVGACVALGMGLGLQSVGVAEPPEVVDLGRVRLASVGSAEAWFHRWLAQLDRLEVSVRMSRPDTRLDRYGRPVNPAGVTVGSLTITVSAERLLKNDWGSIAEGWDRLGSVSERKAFLARFVTGVSLR